MATISNIFIDQGADFSTTVTVSDGTGSAIDLTSYTAIAQIRKSYSSSTATSFTVEFATDRTTGELTVSLTDTQTTALEAGRYLYDVLITNGATSPATSTRVVEGIATINPSISR